MLRPGLLLQEIFRSRPAESFSTPLRVACRQPHWFPSVVTEHPIWAVFCVRLPETQSSLRATKDHRGCLVSAVSPQTGSQIARRRLGFSAPDGGM